MDTIPAPSPSRALHALLDTILLLDRRASSARQVAFPRVLEVLLARHARTDLSLHLEHPHAVLALRDW
jgi:hypothetical protein